MDTSPDPVRKPPFLARAIGTGLFVGYVPWASGTFGTMVGCAVLLIPGAWEATILWPLAAVGFAAGVWSARVIAEFEGHKLSRVAAITKALFQQDHGGVPDPSIVVIDEIVGIWITVLYIPPSLLNLAIAFFWFRLFDIVKPPPARRSERIGNGWGIMLDDVIAGVYANVASHLTIALAFALHLLK